MPKKWAASLMLHRILAWGMNRCSSPQANWLILRHFHLGSQVLAFIAANSGVQVTLSPLTPMVIDDLKDEVFLKHDLNLFNFIINLNRALRAEGRTLKPAIVALALETVGVDRLIGQQRGDAVGELDPPPAPRPMRSSLSKIDPESR